MADFSALMAEMIARSRPQQAPSPGHTAVMGGSPVLNRETAVTANVDASAIVGGIRELVGYKSPEEKEKVFSDFQQYLDQLNDVDRAAVINDPKHQVLLDGFVKAGVPGIIPARDSVGHLVVRADTPKPMIQWTIPKKSEGALGAKVFGAPSAAGIGAGLYGKGPAQQSIETTRQVRVPLPEEVLAAQQARVRLPEEQKQIMEQEKLRASEAVVISGALGSEVAQQFIDNKIRMEQGSVHPELVNQYKENNKLIQRQAEHYAELAKTDPDKARAYIKEADASAELKFSEKKLIDEKIKLANDPTLAGLTPETKLILTEADRSYNDSLKQLEKAYTPVGGYKTTDYKSEYEKLSEMAELTNKHAIKTGDIVSRYRGTAANIEYFTNQVENYINTEYAAEMTKGPGGLNLGVGRIGGGAVAARKADAEAKKIDLMKRVIALHKMPGIAGTERSFAAARMYNDTLKLLNPPVSGPSAPAAALPPGLPPRPQPSAPTARPVPQPAPPAAISTTNLPAPGVAAQPQAKPSAPVVAAQGAAPGTTSIYKPIGKYIIENLPRDLSAFAPAQIKKMLKDAGYSQEEIDSYFSVSSQQPPQPAPQQ